jgi:prepilin-type N-terminal cleavage/methylation domain-containing protein
MARGRPVIRGLTLLEVLAATMLLGLLAAAVVPTHLASMRAERDQRERIEADALLRSLALATAPPPVGETPVPGRRGWSVRVAELPPRTLLVRRSGVARHRWLRCSVRVDSREIAQALVVADGP